MKMEKTLSCFCDGQLIHGARKKIRRRKIHIPTSTNDKKNKKTQSPHCHCVPSLCKLQRKILFCTTYQQNNKEKVEHELVRRSDSSLASCLHDNPPRDQSFVGLSLTSVFDVDFFFLDNNERFCLEWKKCCSCLRNSNTHKAMTRTRKRENLSAYSHVDLTHITVSAFSSPEDMPVSATPRYSISIVGPGQAVPQCIAIAFFSLKHPRHNMTLK